MDSHEFRALQADSSADLDDFDRQLLCSSPPPLSSPPKRRAPEASEGSRKAARSAHGIRLKSPRELPDRTRHVFPFPRFNAVQSKCFDVLYHTDDNMVVTAPTGSGKTCLFELAIARLAATTAPSQFKVVYQAPTKSLCAERARDWAKFLPLGIDCAELTGDTMQPEVRQAAGATIIITTPEKWDSITRKWRDYAPLLSMVKLFLIDEVHILRDVRGATLEAIVSRTKSAGDVRFVAVGATAPNAADMATWLGRDAHTPDIPARLETFGEAFRPVQLQKFVHGFDARGWNDFAFDKALDGKLPGLVARYSQRKPILVFCFTRKSCENAAAALAAASPRSAALRVSHKDLQRLIARGVAFHHAGLDLRDRQVIEAGFRDGQISVICCTSTLAVGVNLPCHLVVVKNTVGFQDGRLCEYSDLEIMQMLGRAGRPQYDTEAIAVIMTRRDKQARYEKMITGQETLESKLHLHLIEHLNSEIGLGTIYDLNSAKTWLSRTFLHVRIKQNPQHYFPDTKSLGSQCESALELLVAARLIALDGERYVSQAYGMAMSRYMISFETMKVLLRVPPKASMAEILHAVCAASALGDVKIRTDQRAWLKDLNSSPFIKYPVASVTSTADKWSLIIQSQLGHAPLPNKDFNGRQFFAEKKLVFDRAQRLTRCVLDCVAADCDAVATRNALELVRSLSAECWEQSPLQLRQVPGIGPVAAQRLVQHGIRTVEQLAQADQFTIERVLSKHPPYGKTLLDTLTSFPRLTLRAEIVTITPGRPPRATVTATLGVRNPRWRGRSPLVVCTVAVGGVLVHLWRGTADHLTHGLDVCCAVNLRGDDEISIVVACDEIVGTAQRRSLKPTYQDDYGEVLDDAEYIMLVEGIEQSRVDTVPVPLESGRWPCQHQCHSGTAPTGTVCKHACGHHGTERRPPRNARQSVESPGTLRSPSPDRRTPDWVHDMGIDSATYHEFAPMVDFVRD